MNRKGYWFKSDLGLPEDEKILAVTKLGGYFNWRKLRVVPEQIMLFTGRAVYEWKIEEIQNSASLKEKESEGLG